MRPGPFRSTLSARPAHLQDRRGDDGEQEDVEEDRADARGHERGDKASGGGRGRGGGPDDEADTKVYHTVTQIRDGSGDAGGNHDEEGRAARNQVSRTDGQLHAGHDDGSAAHAD